MSCPTVAIIEGTTWNGVHQEKLEVCYPDEFGKFSFSIEEFYERWENGEDEEALMEEIIDLFQRYCRDYKESGCLGNFLYLKNRIICSLVNRRSNEALLKLFPHRPFLDLEVIYQTPLTNTPNALCTITNEMLRNWGMTEEELFQIAMKNMESEEVVHSIVDLIRNHSQKECDEELLEEITADEQAGRIPNALLCTNRQFYLGAAQILRKEVQAVCLERAQGDFYVIPASIHEILIVPASDLVSFNGLQKTVREVNTEIAKQETVLSDHIYYYDAKEKRFWDLGEE